MRCGGRGEEGGLAGVGASGDRVSDRALTVWNTNTCAVTRSPKRSPHVIVIVAVILIAPVMVAALVIRNETVALIDTARRLRAGKV